MIGQLKSRTRNFTRRERMLAGEHPVTNDLRVFDEELHPLSTQGQPKRSHFCTQMACPSPLCLKTPKLGTHWHS